MRKIVALVLILDGLLAGASVAQSTQSVCAPRIDWQQGRTGSPVITFTQFKPVLENGYIVAGYSSAQTPSNPNYGGQDFYVTRLDTNFNNIWIQHYGGPYDDFTYAVQETTNGGFILGGESSSPTNSCKTSPNYGSADFWVVRIDANGIKLWDRSYGGNNLDFLVDLQQTTDGGYILGGTSSSGPNGNKTSPIYGLQDYWVIRIDANGNKLWERSFGGTVQDILKSVQQTSDGGFIIGGHSASPADGNKTAVSFGEWDYWIVRLDADGNKLWDRAFGGTADDFLSKVQQTSDGGFILVGSSQSSPSGNKTSPQYGWQDYWIVRVDTNGNKLWEQSAGGTYYQEATSVVGLADGSWVLGGVSTSNADGTKTALHYGGADYWLVRLSATGDLLWDQSYGGNDQDQLFNLHLMPDGQLLLAGDSYSGANGNKTIPGSGNRDLWVLKLAQETPGDCDGDGVPDSQDFCPQTPPGSIINTNGCSIEQLCPCNGDWEDNAVYVECITRTSADFVAAGIISEEQRSNIIAQAVASGCPFGPASEAMLIFGLFHWPSGQANLGGDGDEPDSVPSQLNISNLGPMGQDGVSIRLGRADSGLFIYPSSDIWGDFNPAWFAEEKAFGRMNGSTHSLVATVRGTKPYYESYPIAVDLSPLQPDSLTFQVFSNQTMVAEATTVGAAGEVVVVSSVYLSPRVNPFWRMPDGSVGAIIEFTAPLPGYGGNTISGPFGEGVIGDRVFIRANHPTNQVDYISRVQVTGWVDYHSLDFVDERLGVFNDAHKALGPAILDATPGRLTILEVTNTSEYFKGVLVETKKSNRFDMDLEPLELLVEDASLQLFGTALVDEVPDPDTFVEAQIRNSHGALELSALFRRFEPPGTNESSSGSLPLLRIKIYDNGTLAGIAIATNGTVVGTLTLPGRTNVPQIIGCGVDIGASNIPPYLAITLKSRAIFNGADGTEFQGNHVRIQPAEPLMPIQSLEGFTAGVISVAAFTITGERSAPVHPALSITNSTNALVLAWPNVNLPFILESAVSLPGAFSTVTNDVEFVESRNNVKLPPETNSNRFFRLRLSSE